MSKVVPAMTVTQVINDGAVSEWQRFYEVRNLKFFDGTEEVLGSMANFHKLTTIQKPDV